ncbi:hypothetical protein PHMEG_00029074 [Phytophthora megakarya]|uniref:Uncharacterized protein n=1 Tax=Phytophthora megakarya TaxID=4795 RepID=A0A225V2X1_9STRA|nr:hypothetical protein PHMEG_00029074 [Phytophthora megakarya]
MLTFPREYCCLLHTNSTVMCNRDDLIITNSNFIDSGATMNAVSPEFCERPGLRDILPVPEQQDILHGMPWLKAANPDIDWVEEKIRPRSTQETTKGIANLKIKTKRPKSRVKMHHKPHQPALRLGGERHAASQSGMTVKNNKLFNDGYYSLRSGTTKYISGKQFSRLLKKPKDVEFTKDRKGDK